MKQQTKSKALIILNIILLMALFTIPVYAYWAGLIGGANKDTSGTVDVGTGEDITVQVELGTQGGDTSKLVPTTVTPSDGQSNSIEITFDVTWVDDALLSGIADAVVSVSIDNIQVNSVDNPHGLISVLEKTGNPTTIELGKTVTFTFVITMSEPDNVGEYNDVAGLPITFDLTFTVDPNQ